MAYTLYYWPLPFRGIFIELLLAEAGQPFEKKSPSSIYPDHRFDRPLPGMAPPYLVEKGGLQIAQMPAIATHLAERHGLMPSGAEARAAATKAILDANDVLEEISQNGGVQMWEEESWGEFRAERLATWMRIFEETYQHHGGPFMLGEEITLADIAALGLWAPMIHALPPLEEDLKRHAPQVSALLGRLAQRPGLEAFLTAQRARDGQGYCGGEIEASLREVLGLKAEG
ncbi:glutathione S-transferase family protein [Pseudoroseicyclus tamaricis]|uniref:Glutathione S-transferase family protein n=1 Tax=Pseudoroseicyclus tamaricis TaxID=2705421 RepID=A0A6B2JSM2_9RHOB|nr:glutathione S-transferase family protein [Pseudoroseicyclus tamaricis]NDU99568.1 glutathione S-transferase family protein [Pseudoroseicyclus tamaricis]